MDSATPQQPLLYTIEEAVELTRISRAKLYEELAAGHLRSVKIGRRRLVPHASLVDFVDRLLAETEASGW